jgi:hypothetical protein
MNSSTLRPLARSKLRRVPFAISLWSGMESEAIYPGFTMIM